LFQIMANRARVFVYAADSIPRQSALLRCECLVENNVYANDRPMTGDSRGKQNNSKNVHIADRAHQDAAQAPDDPCLRV